MSATDPMSNLTRAERHAQALLAERDEALRRVAAMHDALRKESARSEQAFRERDEAIAARDRLPVGTRVTHVDPDGKALPMAGTVVAINVRYLVEWDGEQPRPLSGWTPTYYYSESDLRALAVDPPLLGPHGLAH